MLAPACGLGVNVNGLSGCLLTPCKIRANCFPLEAAERICLVTNVAPQPRASLGRRRDAAAVALVGARLASPAKPRRAARKAAFLGHSLHSRMSGPDDSAHTCDLGQVPCLR